MADQTVGVASVGGSSAAGDTFAIASSFTTPAVAGGGTCTFYVYLRGLTTTYSNCILAVWADNGSDAPGTLLATGPTITPTNTEGWYSGTFTWNDIAAGTKYWLGAVFEDASGSTNLWYSSTGATGRGKYKTASYPTVPDPFGTASAIARIYSFYVVYPEAVSGGSNSPGYAYLQQ